MSPDRPEAALPVDIRSCPELPLLVVPDVNESAPLTPLFPASEDCTTMLPLDFAVPAPLTNDTEPPVADPPTAFPPDTSTPPPIEEVPVPLPPTTSEMVICEPFAFFHFVFGSEGIWC